MKDRKVGESSGGERKDGNTTGRFPDLKFEDIFRARNGMLCHKEHRSKRGSMKYKLCLTWILIINELLLLVSIMKMCCRASFNRTF